MQEREVEQAALAAAVAAAMRRTGALVVLEGGSGAGRSALLEWMTGPAGPIAGASVTAHAARATLLGRDVPFSLAYRLLEPAVARAPEVLDAGWARHARALFEPSAGRAASPALLIEGLVALVAALVRRDGPLVLACDDIQWADPSSMAVLCELALRRDELAVGLVLTLNRAEEAIDPSRVAELRALAGSDLHELAALSPDAVRRLIGELRPGRDAERVEAVVAAAAGNPRLVMELLDAVSGDRALAVPGALAGRVLAMLSRLGESARTLAQSLAVLEEAPLHRAAALAHMTGREAEVAADQLISAGIVAAGEPLRFVAPVLAPALQASVAPYELAQRHRRAAALLHRDGGDLPAVAMHLLRARPDGDPWVAEQLRRAAEISLERGDPGAAVRLLERALTEPPAAAQRGAVLLGLARSQAARGRPEAIAAFELALGHMAGGAQRADAWHAPLPAAARPRRAPHRRRGRPARARRAHAI